MLSAEQHLEATIRKDDVFPKIVGEMSEHYSFDDGFSRIVKMNTAKGQAKIVLFDDELETEIYYTRAYNTATLSMLVMPLLNRYNPNAVAMNEAVSSLYLVLLSDKDDDAKRYLTQKQATDALKAKQEVASKQISSLAYRCPSPLSALRQSASMKTVLSNSMYIEDIDALREILPTHRDWSKITKPCINEWKSINDKVDEITKNLEDKIAQSSSVKPPALSGVTIGDDSVGLMLGDTRISISSRDSNETFREHLIVDENQNTIAGPDAFKGSTLKTVWLDSAQHIAGIVVSLERHEPTCNKALKAWNDALREADYITYSKVPVEIATRPPKDTRLTNGKYVFSGVCNSHKPELVVQRLFKPLVMRDIAIEYIMQGKSL